MHLDGDRNTVYFRANVRPHGFEWALQCYIAHPWRFLQGQENFGLASAVLIAFALGELAGNRIGMREVIDAASAGLEDDLLTAYQAGKGAVPPRFEVGVHGLPVGFSSCAEQCGELETEPFYQVGGSLATAAVDEWSSAGVVKLGRRILFFHLASMFLSAKCARKMPQMHDEEAGAEKLLLWSNQLFLR